jgi:hypothetical protein
MSTTFESLCHELQTALVEAEDPRHDDDVNAHLERCPACAATMREIEDVELHLASAVAEMDSVLAEAAELESAPGTSRIAARLEELAAASDTGRPRLTLLSRIQPWLLAAACILAATAAVMFVRNDSAPLAEDRVFLGGGIELIAPIGEVPDFAEFRFTAQRPRGASFEIVVHDAEGRELRRSPPLQDTTYRPDPAWLAGLPATIEWEVRMFDSTGFLDTAKGAATRP